MENADHVAEEVTARLVTTARRRRGPHREPVTQALSSGSCDLVSLARPLLANPDLPALFLAGQESPKRPCTFCNRCAIRTTLFPPGCYEPKRLASDAEMEAQILDWSARPDAVKHGSPSRP